MCCRTLEARDDSCLCQDTEAVQTEPGNQSASVGLVVLYKQYPCLGVRTWQRLKNLLYGYASQTPWIPKEEVFKMIWMSKQAETKRVVYHLQITDHMCMVITGRVSKKASGRRPRISHQAFLLPLLAHTDSLTINTEKYSSKCSGVKAYGTFDFVCV